MSERTSWMAERSQSSGLPLTRLGDGETRVTESFQLVKPLGPISRLVRITIGVRDLTSDLEQNVRVSLENLQRIAEG